MTVVGRLQPFVAVTRSIAFAMPAKGENRPQTAIHGDHAQGQLPDQKATFEPIAAVQNGLFLGNVGICHKSTLAPVFLGRLSSHKRPPCRATAEQ
jgi:hypothetical protein